MSEPSASRRSQRVKAGRPGARGDGPAHREAVGADTASPAESELLLRLAIEATGIGIFDCDVMRDRLHLDARTRGMFGIDADEPVTCEETFLRSLHPDDCDRIDRALRKARDPKGPGLFDEEYRTLSPDGAVTRWFAARGRLVVEEERAVRLVGTLRDITDAKSSEVALRATEERYRLVTRATNDAIWDWDLVADHVLWNEALCTAYGWEPHQVEPTGAWWIARVHPDDRAHVEADIRSVIDGTADEWSHEYRFLRADGTYAEVLDRGYMVRSATGAARRMIGAMLDITERSRAEAQFRAVFEGANIGILQLDPHSLRALRVNAKLCEIWGATRADIVGHSVAKWTPEEDAAERDRLHRRLSSGEIMRELFEKRYRRKDGQIIWARVNLVSQLRGEEILITAMIEDITEEKLAEARREALIELGDRLRDARTAGDVAATTAEILGRTLDVARAGYATVDAAGDRFTIERDWAEGTSAGPARSYALEILDTTVARLRRGETVAVASAVPWLSAEAESRDETGLRAGIQVPLVQRGELVGVLYAHALAPRTWTQGEIDFARESAERAWDGLTRIQADEQQRFLNRELSHRLKNTLAIVQAIASQSLRNVTDIEVAKEALASRLIALGKAHDILLTDEREAAGIDAVIAGALAIHDDRQPGRFRLDGPSILIGPRGALSLALMMHELATNAVKYGALSVPEGRVSVAWEVEETASEPTVLMRWTEQGGPPVVVPVRKGFGSRLIERGLAGAIGGEVVLAYEPSGVVCRVTAPLAGFQANA